MKRSLMAIASCSIAGCIAYPKEVQYYDSDCHIEWRKMTLAAQDMGNIHCSHAVACAAILGVSAGSVIVSGTIVVAGNTVYWMEKRGKCVPIDPSIGE